MTHRVNHLSEANLMTMQAGVLEGHKSYVKGVAWDPIGTYIASQSDDKSIIIWRCSDWSIIYVVTSPFEEVNITHAQPIKDSHTESLNDNQYCRGMSVKRKHERLCLTWWFNQYSIHPICMMSGSFVDSCQHKWTLSLSSSQNVGLLDELGRLHVMQNFVTSTFSLRLTWNPDGQYVSGANSFQAPKHGAALLTRGSWKADLGVMGHKAPVTVISYSPLLYHSDDPDDPDYCYACGSQVLLSISKYCHTISHRTVLNSWIRAVDACLECTRKCWEVGLNFSQHSNL